MSIRYCLFDSKECWTPLLGCTMFCKRYKADQAVAAKAFIERPGIGRVYLCVDCGEEMTSNVYFDLESKPRCRKCYRAQKKNRKPIQEYPALELDEQAADFCRLVNFRHFMCMAMTGRVTNAEPKER